MFGWPGSTRRCSSNATSMTRWCIVSANARPAHCGRRSGTGWSRSGCGYIPTRPRSCTAGTTTDVAATPLRRSRSWGSRSGHAKRATATAVHSRRSCPRSATKPSKGSVEKSAAAAASTDRAEHRRPRPSDQPARARLAAVLRGVLPLRDAHPPAAHQRLLAALDPQEIPTTSGIPQSQGSLATHHQPAPTAVRPLGMGPHARTIRMTRAG
jgi:hypothetical protein